MGFGFLIFGKAKEKLISILYGNSFFWCWGILGRRDDKIMGGCYEKGHIFSSFF